MTGSRCGGGVSRYAERLDLVVEGAGVGREVPAPRLRVLVPRLAEYDDEREPITGLDGLLSGMPAAPFDSFYG